MRSVSQSYISLWSNFDSVKPTQEEKHNSLNGKWVHSLDAIRTQIPRCRKLLQTGGFAKGCFDSRLSFASWAIRVCLDTNIHAYIHVAYPNKNSSTWRKHTTTDSHTKRVLLLLSPFKKLNCDTDRKLGMVLVPFSDRRRISALNVL